MNSNEIRTMTPDEFAAEYAPAPFQKPDDYFIRNRETGKLELHFAKATYDALDDAQNARSKARFCGAVVPAAGSAAPRNPTCGARSALQRHWD